jgi:hypothetical protein
MTATKAKILKIATTRTRRKTKNPITLSEVDQQLALQEVAKRLLDCAKQINETMKHSVKLFDKHAAFHQWALAELMEREMITDEDAHIKCHKPSKAKK